MLIPEVSENLESEHNESLKHVKSSECDKPTASEMSNYERFMASIRRECKSRQLIEMRNQTCSICKSAPVQFKHFGAYSCNRCRAFFRELSWRYFSPIFQAYLFTSRTNLENLQKRDYFRPILMFRF